MKLFKLATDSDGWARAKVELEASASDPQALAGAATGKLKFNFKLKSAQTEACPGLPQAVGRSFKFKLPLTMEVPVLVVGPASAQCH